MKNLILLGSLLIFGFLPLLGQIPVITSGGFGPVVGDFFPGKVADGPSTAGFSPGMGGANLVWDVSGLTFSGGNSITTVGHVGQPYSIQFPNATIAQHHSAINSWYYYDLSASYFEFLGSSIPGYGYVSHSNSIRYVNFPATYLDTINDTFEGVFREPIGIGMRTQGTVTGSYDGYGTLITPNDNFANVLRMHYQESYLDSNANGDTNHVSVEAYLWIQEGFHYPILIYREQYDGGVFTNRTLILFEEQIVGIAPSLSGNEISLFPNPTAGAVLMDFTLPHLAEVDIECWDLTGRLVGVQTYLPMNSGPQQLYLDVLSNQPAGSYIVVLTQAGDLIGRERVVKAE